MRRLHIPDDTERQSQVEKALESIPPEELRTCIRVVLRQLDHGARLTLEDLLLSARSSAAGRHPSGAPSSEFLAELEDFVATAHSHGWAEPEDIDHYLHSGQRYFLRRDYRSARTIFGHLLPPICDGDICVGHYEDDVDEVLEVDVDRCRGQFVVSVYMTTAMDMRAEAIFEVMMETGWSASDKPLHQMEMTAVEELADFDAFLPLWIEWLSDRAHATDDEWEREELECAHREALLRDQGVAGLETHARDTHDVNALMDWCRAVLDTGDWAEAFEAFQDSAKLAKSSGSIGWFLDGIALAAQHLGRRDVARRLEDAWRGDPSADRLLRWLGAQSPSRTTLRRRAAKALKHCPESDAWQLGLIHVLTGDSGAAGQLLEKSRALGWSHAGHPGWLLMGAFVSMSSEGRLSKVGEALQGRMQRSGGVGRGALFLEGLGKESETALTLPAIAELVRLAKPMKSLGPATRSRMHEAMCKATKRRVDAIVSKKLRRHYDTCALLMVACLEFAEVAERETRASSWFDRLRAKYSRHSAFQRELKSALRASPKVNRLA